MQYKLKIRGTWPELKAKLRWMFPTLNTDDIRDEDDGKAIVLDRLRALLEKTAQEITRILNRA